MAVGDPFPYILPIHELIHFMNVCKLQALLCELRASLSKKILEVTRKNYKICKFQTSFTCNFTHYTNRPVVQALNGLSSAGMRGSMHELAIAHDQYYYGRSIQKKSKEKQNMLQLGRNTRQRVHRNFSSIQNEAVKLLTVMLIFCIQKQLSRENSANSARFMKEQCLVIERLSASQHRRSNKSGRSAQ